MKLTNIKKYSIVVTLALSLTACGGGGGGSTSSTSISNVVSSVIDDNMFQFAWHINKDINTTFKTSNNIDDEAHISLEEAWAITKGKQTNGEAIKVAVIDEDFEVNHPNIKDKVFYTYNESNGGTNISDTDGDSFYHGLAAAGIIAGDEVGVAPNVKLALININLATQGSSIDKYLTAFNKAKEAGAKVINCSWEIIHEDPDLWDSYTLTLRALIEDFKDQGIIIVFASGNDGADLDQVGEKSLSELDSVIGVGATSVKNDVTSYSNYGSSIDVLAPGGGSLNDGLLGILSLDQSGSAGENKNTQLSYTNENLDNYTLTSGTSFAAPTTTGLVALILSVNPNLTFAQVRNILISTTDKVGGTNADYSVGSFDTKRAYGKINAKKAIEAAQASLNP